mmetsp:Transcript_15659/g.47694  ORF Transcript_15659/g.47694 Transcript_15659/m.47694 type:complete len:248 (+) Transcript_15659:131-874(+)
MMRWLSLSMSLRLRLGLSRAAAAWARVRSLSLSLSRAVVGVLLVPDVAVVEPGAEPQRGHEARLEVGVGVHGRRELGREAEAVGRGAEAKLEEGVAAEQRGHEEAGREVHAGPRAGLRRRDGQLREALHAVHGEPHGGGVGVGRVREHRVEGGGHVRVGVHEPLRVVHVVEHELVGVGLPKPVVVLQDLHVAPLGALRRLPHALEARGAAEDGDARVPRGLRGLRSIAAAAQRPRLRRVGRRHRGAR